MWTSTENQGNFLGRISIRRNQVASAEGDVEDLEFFQKKIAERFSDLLPSSCSSSSSHQHHHHVKEQHGGLPPIPPSAAAATAASADASDASAEGGGGGAETPVSVPSESLLSIAWLRKLLDAFLCCEAEFKAVLLMGRDPSHIIKSPLDKLIPELLERTVKALDVCNAITHGVEAIRHVQKQAEIAVTALDERPFTDGQVCRAKKALASVLTSIVIEEKELNPSKSTERSWSFGRRSSGSGSSAALKDRHISNFRSLSWSVSKTWSAAKQIQAISSNLYPPRGGGESTGLAMTVYIMSVVLAFVMWTLVAAIPCQERAGLGTHISVPKQLGWAQGMSGLQEKIAEEWKKKEKKGGASAGLMEEVVRVEKTAQGLMDCLAQFQFPMEEEKEVEVETHVADLADICRRMEEGLGPLQQQIREVFHRIVRSRAEVLDMLEQAAKASSSSASNV